MIRLYETLIRFTVTLVLLSAACGATVEELNQPLDASNNPTATVDRIPIEDVRARRPFIGIAISGGGSRAANFGAAVLEELDRHGFLKHVTAISAVSGGALPAMYYALNRHRPLWSWTDLREKMRLDFHDRFIRRHRLGIVPYLFAESYTRSSMMAEVFDETLFSKAQYKDLNPDGPSVLLHATVIPSFGNLFTFSDRNFAQELNSRLDTFSISNAVAASTAVPGVFHSVALKNYRSSTPTPYVHLVDGGMSDNLGLEGLLHMVSLAEQANQSTEYRHGSPEGNPIVPCFIFVIDAFVAPSHKQSYVNRDSRQWSDFIIDHNLLEALDASFARRRHDVFGSLGPVDWYEQVIFSLKLPVGFDGGLRGPFYHFGHCIVWHFTLGRTASNHPHLRLFPYQAEPPYEDKSKVQLAIQTIETWWNLKSTGNCDSVALQDALYDAAAIQVNEFTLPYKQAKDWFIDNKVPGASEIDSPRHLQEYQFLRNRKVIQSEKGEIKCEAVMITPR